MNGGFVALPTREVFTSFVLPKQRELLMLDKTNIK
jgi:hypothetical protein